MGKWEDFSNVFCNDCKDGENLIKIDNKCEECGKIGKYFRENKGEYYFCKIHDPYKKERGEDEGKKK